MDNYPHTHAQQVRAGIKYLNKKGNQKFCVPKKTCSRVSCSYGTGINVCNGKQKTQCFTAGGIGKKVSYLAHKVCNNHLNRAFQGFYVSFLFSLAKLYSRRILILTFSLGHSIS